MVANAEREASAGRHVDAKRLHRHLASVRTSCPARFGIERLINRLMRPLCPWRVRCASLLPHQILVEPRNCSFEGVNLVFAFGETVAFSGIVMRVHRAAFLLQDLHHLLGFFLRNADVVLTLQYQERRLFIADVLDR